MKVSTKTVKALNDQIAMEAFASNYYLSMASWCETTGYKGAASYLYAQSDEERMHMLKIVKHLNILGNQAVIPQLKQPPQTFRSLEDLFKIALRNEQEVTKSINKIVDMTQKEKDHSTFTFLQWYVTEQTQEETKFEEVLQKFDLLGRDKLAINEIDKYLAGLVTQSETNTA